MTALPTYEERVAAILRELGIPASYGRERNMTLFPEATELVVVVRNNQGREFRLAPRAAQAWSALQMAAKGEGIVLQLISAFRSLDHQKQIIQRKLAAGESLENILRVSAAPGYSEHHTGRAVDLATPQSLPLLGEFESTPAFAWLAANAGDFGFVMTYPRDNPQGIIYEPWHWTLAEG